jgi:hypothetical protein
MNIRREFKETAVMSDPSHAPGERSPTRDASHEEEQALVHIREALRGLEFGGLSIIVQDGVVIQIERTERKRLRKKHGGPT